MNVPMYNYVVATNTSSILVFYQNNTVYIYVIRIYNCETNELLGKQTAGNGKRICYGFHKRCRCNQLSSFLNVNYEYCIRVDYLCMVRYNSYYVVYMEKELLYVKKSREIEIPGAYISTIHIDALFLFIPLN